MATPHFPLSYLDFMPVCLKKEGMMNLPEFERFDVLIMRANDWLAGNAGMKVRTCESLELPYRTYTADQTVSTLDNDCSMYYETGKRAMCYVRGLRLWIASKTPEDDPDPVRLGYYNVVPACLKTGGIFSAPTFERFDATLTKINEMFSAQPLQGRIINIETQDFKFETWGNQCDPDSCFWWESGKSATCFLNILRIFYAGGPPTLESIGCVDIVPQVSGSGYGGIKGEPFAILGQRANQWVTEHPGIRVTNMQSINYKVHLSGWSGTANQGVDTMRTLFYKAGKGVTVLCRIIRICFVSSAESQSLSTMLQVSYRSFMPAMVRPSGSTVFYNPKFETMTQNMGRLVAWLNYTGARVVGIETLRMVIRLGALDPESTITYDSGSSTDVWLYLFRIYLDGHYTDPPVEALPAPPPMEEPQSMGCCTLL